MNGECKSSLERIRDVSDRVAKRYGQCAAQNKGLNP